jgi:hypothetical protein
MTTRIDPAATMEEARTIELEGVWKPQKRPLAGVERVEARIVPMGHDRQPRVFLIEFRKARKKRSSK